MQTWLFWRALPRSIIALIALAVGALFVGQNSDQASAGGNFDSEFGVTLTSSATGANADVGTTFKIDDPNLNFAAVTTHFPAAATTAAGPTTSDIGAAPALGHVAGTLTSSTTLGLNNLPCAPPQLSISFTFLNATVNNASNLIYPSLPHEASSVPPTGTLAPFRKDVNTVSPGPGSAGPGSAVSPPNGLPAHVDLYPSYLNTLFNNLQPLARYSASTVVAGSAIVLQFVVFNTNAPSWAAAFPPPHPLSDLTNTGYASISVLQDPTQPAAPSAITDFCTPLDVSTMLFGVLRSNSCRGVTTSPCNTDAAINEGVVPGTPTGIVRYANPGSAGTHYFMGFNQSLRDTDNDKLENSFDTCPYTPTPAFNPRSADAANDADADAIPGGGPAGGCDPTPTTNLNNGNQDGDTAPNGQPWQNAGDNCVLASNGTQDEQENTEPDNIARPRGGSQTDALGDACDTPETVCTEVPAADNDGDGLVNDGCPAFGAPEVGCLNSANDDADGAAYVNDGCPSSARVANGHFHTTVNLVPKCIGAADGDGDGVCDAQETALGSSPTSALSTPEHYSLVMVFPVAHSGSGNSPGADREPKQVCNDGLDNDGDGAIDLLEGDGPDSGGLGDCNPQDYTRAPFGKPIPTIDTDGDGGTDFEELFVGTDALGRCEVGSTTVPSGDWTFDLAAGTGSIDRISLLDLSSFVSPVARLNTSPGLPGYSPRWDVAAGTTAGHWINLLDLSAVVTRTAPMFGGAAVFNGPVCTAHPTFND